MLNYQAGDAAAFECLYARHKGPLFRYFQRQLAAQPELANELFQDVWMKLINSIGRYQPSARFTTYLYRIAHNRLVDHWRAMRIDDPLDEEQLPDTVGSAPEQQLAGQQLQQQFEQALAALPMEQRNAFLLKEESHFSLQEIADITGTSRETVKSRLRYACQRLRQVLAHHYEH
jgi:RNA polymerase sigma-70 factor (ECF subfamily)